MKKLFCIILLIIPSLCFSQRYLWQRSYGTDQNDWIIKTIKSKDKSFIVLIDISSNSKVDSIAFIKFDSLYNQIWVKYQPFRFIDDIVENSDGSFTAAGGSSKPTIIQYDSSGNEISLKTYSHWINNYFYKIHSSSDKGYLIRFWYEPNQRNVLKINESGDTVYSLPIRPGDIFQLQDSFIAASGTYFNKYTNDGILVHNKNYSLSFDVSKIYKTREEGYFLAGEGLYGSGLGLAKVNNHGDTAWTKFYKEHTSTYVKEIQQTADSGFLMLCQGYGFDEDIVLFKADKFGNRQWLRTLVRMDNRENPSALFLNCDSSIVIIGTATNGQLGGSDIMMLKMDRLPYVAGKCVWEEQYHKSFLKEREIIAYPNPVHEVLNVRLKDRFSGMATITNLLGQVIANYNFTDINYFNLPFSAYSPGLYILTLTDPENKEVKKIKLFKH